MKDIFSNIGELVNLSIIMKTFRNVRQKNQDLFIHGTRIKQEPCKPEYIAISVFEEQHPIEKDGSGCIALPLFASPELRDEILSYLYEDSLKRAKE